jgi:hypothetical protein
MDVSPLSGKHVDHAQFENGGKRVFFISIKAEN